jgi:hypothetical protein
MLTMAGRYLNKWKTYSSRYLLGRIAPHGSMQGTEQGTAHSACSVQPAMNLLASKEVLTIVLHYSSSCNWGTCFLQSSAYLTCTASSVDANHGSVLSIIKSVALHVLMRCQRQAHARSPPFCSEIAFLSPESRSPYSLFAHCSSASKLTTTLYSIQ